MCPSRVVISGVDKIPSDPAVRWPPKLTECFNFCGFFQTDSAVTDGSVLTGHSEFVSGKGGTHI